MSYRETPLSDSEQNSGVLVALPWVKLSQAVEAAREAEGEAEPQSSSFERLAERLQTSERIVSSESARAPVLYAELLSLPRDKRLVQARNSQRFASYLLCEMLLESARQAWFDEPSRAVEMAELAVAVAERLDAEFYGMDLTRALQARAWAYLGNGRRINYDLRAASAAFHRAAELLGHAGVQISEQTEISSLKISLLVAERRFEQALELCDEVIALHRDAGDTHQVGRVLIQKGQVSADMGEPLRAVECLREGIGVIDPAREPRLLAVALHNLALCHNELGKHPEGLECLERARPLFERLGDRMDLIRLRWLGGRLAQGMGEREEAEEAFLEARDAFIDCDVGADAALVSLDLALLYVELEDGEKIRHLAEKMLRIFETGILPHESRAALSLFRHAAEKELVTPGLIHELVAFLQGARERQSRPENGS